MNARDARARAALHESLGRLEELVQALRCLPGVGPKAAQRMALHLLQHDRDGAARLAHALVEATQNVQHCERCNTFTEGTLCALCRSGKRDATQLCVVETPADLLMVEQTQAYSGLYFVLMGRLSPLDGIGPEELSIEQLVGRVARANGAERVREVIIATNPSLEGEATALYVQRQVAPHVPMVTRIARGLPVGGDLEYADGVTIAQALSARRAM